jgi:hypothetical protein
MIARARRGHCLNKGVQTLSSRAPEMTPTCAQREFDNQGALSHLLAVPTDAGNRRPSFQ